MSQEVPSDAIQSPMLVFSAAKSGEKYISMMMLLNIDVKKRLNLVHHMWLGMNA